MVAGYTYTSLRDLGEFVKKDRNVYGIIVDGNSHPVKSKGSDWFVKFKITDPSSGSGAMDPDLLPHTEVMCFAKDAETLPQFEYGNIIRLHRAKVDMFESPTGVRHQLVLQVGWMVHVNGSRTLRKSSFAMFDGEVDSDVPLAHSSDTMTFQEVDTQQLRTLRRFWKAFPTYTRVPSTYVKSLKELALHTHDLICKVLMTSAGLHPHATVVYVWDGTDTPPRGPLPSDPYTQHLLEHVPHLAQHQRVCEPEVAAMEDWPAFGSVLPVLIPVAFGKDLPEPGKWIKLFNLAGWTCDGQWQGLFRDDSQWQTYVDDRGREDESVRRRMEERQRTNEVSQWASTRQADLLECITRTNHNNPFTTLRSVLQTPPPMKFRCLVRCIRIQPERAGNCCIFWREQRRWVYALKLVVEDSTACIPLSVFDDDGATFFHGVQPTDLAQSSSSTEALDRKLRKLLGADTETGEPPWIQCCLRSYLDHEGMLRFRIFDTALP